MINPSFVAPDRETALLLACARTRLPDEEASRVSELARGALDWKRLLGIAERHGLMPLLWRSLATVCPQLVPAQTETTLRAWQRANTLRNMTLLRDLLRLVRSLAAQGVRALPYKGPVLAEMAYGDLALRHSVDLDLLVRKHDVAEARRIMAALGYTLTAECRQHESAYTHVHHHYAFGHSTSGTMVELHWRMVDRHFSLRMSFDDLWQRSVLFTLGGQQVQAPSCADMLLAVCIHGCMHGWKQLKQVCDVAELVQKLEQIDWAALLSNASASGCRRMLLLGVSLAGRLLAAPIPVAARAAVAADQAVAALGDDIMAAIFADRPAPDESDMRSFFGYYALLRERRRDPVEEAFRRLFIPTMAEWESPSLPAPLTVMHYALRPLRLTARRLNRLLHKRA